MLNPSNLYEFASFDSCNKNAGKLKCVPGLRTDIHLHRQEFIAVYINNIMIKVYIYIFLKSKLILLCLLITISDNPNT